MFKLSQLNYLKHPNNLKNLKHLIKRYSHPLIATILLIVLIASFFFIKTKAPSIFAATYYFIQNSWSGGASTTALALHPTDSTGWTKYQSASSSIIAGANITASTTSSNWPDNFSGGTPDSNTYVSGGLVNLKKNNGVTCSADQQCTAGNCDGDFSSGNYCHATVSSCVNYALGTPWERATGYALCSGSSYYKLCTNSAWGAQQNCDTNNAYCDAGGGATSGYDLAETCTSGATGGCNATSCASCSPYLAASTSSCKTSCSSASDCWSGYGCAGTTCAPLCDASTTCGASCVYNSDMYTTVQIGTQCWLAENLRTTLKPDGSGLTSYCDPSGCASPWGRLYNWDVAMNGATTATICGEKIRGICPSDWHIPSGKTGCANDDFPLLSSYLGGDSVSGGAMKQTGTTYWTSPNTGATNSSGFTGVGAGYWSTNNFLSRSASGLFWTSFQQTTSEGLYHYLVYNNATLSYNFYAKSGGFSVRCVKD